MEKDALDVAKRNVRYRRIGDSRGVEGDGPVTSSKRPLA
jgi:hypothetical protein